MERNLELAARQAILGPRNSRMGSGRIRKRTQAYRSCDASVVFLGPQFGAEKSECYRACDAFILPSLSEGLPMTVLEAWSYAKPVLMTAECNLPEGFAAGAAVRIGPVPGRNCSWSETTSRNERRRSRSNGNTWTHSGSNKIFLATNWRTDARGL